MSRRELKAAGREMLRIFLCLGGSFRVDNKFILLRKIPKEYKVIFF